MSASHSATTISVIAAELKKARRRLIITGAGISTDSGLPTYRGIGGLYQGRATEDGMPIEEALSSTMLRDRPEVTWKYLWEIAEKCRTTLPNRCHEILTNWQKHTPNTWILTQNVDGLHTKAGSQKVIEIHGRAATLRCVHCPFHTDGNRFLHDERRYHSPHVPKCPDCGHVLRPDVVLFGEDLPRRALKTLEQLAEDGVDLVMSIGTSSLFPYITAPMQLAHAAGIPTVEINLEETEATPFARHILRMPCTEALESLTNNANFILPNHADND